MRQIIKKWNNLKADYRIKYIDSLFKKDVPMTFEDGKDGSKFIGTIRGISANGKLIIALHDGSQEMHYDIKEIRMLY